MTVLAPPPHGIFATRESTDQPIEVTIWHGQALHKERIGPKRALRLANELIALALQGGLTEGKEE